MDSKWLLHTFSPVYDAHSEILILGSFPSVKSRENSFYYGHPQNRFWRVLSSVYQSELPETIAEKKTFLLKNHIALWDVVQSCEISGSADSTIQNVVPNDIGLILNSAPIQNVYANGKTAEKLYNRCVKKQVQREITALPSTSPANAAFSLDKLIKHWQCILANRA